MDLNQGREPVDWNDTIIAHPNLSPTDKLVFHLLERLGGDSPQARRQIAALLRLSPRQVRRICAKLPLCSSVDNSPAPPANVDNWRTCTSAADIHVRPRTSRSAPPTHTRTSSTSSDEEVYKKDSPVLPTPPGGAGGAEPDPLFLTQMRGLWSQIEPGCRAYPESWFAKLHREFGPERPLSILQRFALAEKTLADLSHPASYKSYFARWCRREQEEDAQMLSLAANAPTRTWASWSPADYEQDLHSASQAARNLSRTRRH